jgi:hypothetical protein
MGCGYACVSMICGEDLDGDGLSVNQMKELLEEKTNRKWAIHGSKDNDEPEQPIKLRKSLDPPTLYLITEKSTPFDVKERVVFHWIIQAYGLIFDPDMTMPLEYSKYPKRHYHYLRKISAKQ